MVNINLKGVHRQQVHRGSKSDVVVDKARLPVPDEESHTWNVLRSPRHSR